MLAASNGDALSIAGKTEAEIAALALSLTRCTDCNGEVSFQPVGSPAADAGPVVAAAVSNVDKTGLFHVRKGVVVDLDGFTLSVLRVRAGLAYCETWVTRVPMTVLCSQVRVVHR